MAALVAVLIFIAFNWNREELKTVRGNFIAITVFPLLMLFAAAFVGGWSWRAKLILVELELTVVVIGILWLAARRVAITAEIAAAAAAASPKLTLQQAADGYAKFVASILAAEIFAGLVVLWAPVHGDLSLSFLGLFIGIGWLVYWLWMREKVEWWKETVKTALTLSLVAIISGVLVPYLMPDTTRELLSRQGAADQFGVSAVRGVVAVIHGDASPFVMFWAFVALFIAIGAGVYFVKEKARRPVRWAGLVLLIALFVSWLVWGAGWDVVTQYVGADRPSAVQRVERRVQVELKPGRTVRLDEEVPKPLVPAGYSVDFEVKSGRVFLSGGGGEPVELGMGKRHPWRSPVVLSGDGTVALLLYRH